MWYCKSQHKIVMHNIYIYRVTDIQCNKIKRLIHKNFFFNFIVQKQKMLKIKSNFRISLDLFQLATFGTNYGPQTADKAVTGSTKVALRYLGPFPAKRRLEMIDSLLYFSEHLTLQNIPGVKVQQIEIRIYWWPLCRRNEARNLLFKPFLVDACWVRSVCGRNVCLSRVSIISLRHFPCNIRH